MYVDQAELPLGHNPGDFTPTGRRWYLKYAVSIGTDRLALLGSFVGLADGDQVVVESALDNQTVRVRTHDLPQGTVVVLPIDGAPNASALEISGAVARTNTVSVPRVDGDISALLRSGLTTLPRADRQSLLAFLIRTCGASRDQLPARLALDLQAARHALRDPRAESIIDPMGMRAAKVEVLARIDPRAYYLRGWIGHGDHALAGFGVVTPEGETVDLTTVITRFTRDDVARFYGEEEDDTGYGFAAHFTVDIPTTSETGWVVELTPYGEPATEAPAPPVTADHLSVRDLLVADLAVEQLPRDELRRHHLKPAITRLQENARGRVRISLVRQFGEPPGDPDVSLIVPLYRRIDFVEHQLAQFVDDPDLATADIVYVLDSPEQRDALVADARRLFSLYHVPFRVAVLSRNGGFSTANNMGARVARGRLLLLMNSDVVPDRPGWLREMVRFHDAIPNVGTVGPKLLYEDDSIQHAGMYFARALDGYEWTNEHYFKGLHRTFDAACESRRVPAVTAACMLIAKDVYERVGGLQGHYVQGDFEDSDLCLRLSTEGLEHWYAAHVELYHLEGQSYPTPLRVLNGEFNRWLHTHQWTGVIDEVMAAQRRREAEEA
jgi:GT2 family glycosyltransferase